MWYHRIFVVDTNRTIHKLTSKGQFKNQTPGRGHNDLHHVACHSMRLDEIYTSALPMALSQPDDKLWGLGKH